MMLPREFDRRLAAHHARQEARDEQAWSQALMLRNTIGRVIGGKKFRVLTLEELKRKAALAAGAGPTKAEYEAILHGRRN